MRIIMPNASAISQQVQQVETNQYLIVALVLAAIFTAIYGIFWRQRRDWSHDGLEAQRDKLRLELAEELERVKDERDHLRDACERVGHERNLAVQQVGKMEGSIDVLTKQVETLEEELRETREELREARDQLRETRAELAEDRALLKGMQDAMNQLIDGVKKLGLNLEKLTEEQP